MLYLCHYDDATRSRPLPAGGGLGGTDLKGYTTICCGICISVRMPPLCAKRGPIIG